MAEDNGAGDDSMAYSQEINRSAQESLIPLTEDLADWLSRILDIKVVVDRFMESLSNGVVLCKLAQLIQAKAVECQRAGNMKYNVPQRKIKCRENATPESFFARDNVATFLSWCRELGLEDTCLFETDGLVLKKSPQNVLVCIYELARLASRLGIEPPGLLKLEKEIEKEEKNPRPVSAPKKKSTLDQEVRRIAREKQVTDISRIKEGKYSIGGKIVLVRMLRGRHVMVRVGGGWETLESYLDKHIVTTFKRVGRTLTADTGEVVEDDFFIMNAKCKGHSSLNNNGRT